MAQNGLLDFLQGASNAAASNVSAPVDGLAWLLRKAGIPVPDAPIGGSDWMAKKGLTAKPQNYLAGLLGESVGGAAPIVAAAKAPQIAKGLLQVEANAMAPTTLRPEAGAIVWHGSPHKFDRFDSSKIGTGEGAQAYGHGLYLAESPTVAAGYKETLSARVKDRLTIDGKVIDPDSMLGRAAEDVPRIGIQATLQKIDDNIRFNEKYAPDMAEMYRGVRAQIASLDPARVAVKEGQLYKVDLPDDKIARMLDWDKPLSQQAPEVRRFFEPTVAPIRAEMAKPANPGWGDLAAPTNFDPTGQELLGLLRNRDAELTAQSFLGNGLGRDVSSTLRQQGIPGIRYLDGGSRGTGTGTSNFVVFPGEENALRILERNGLLAP